MSQRLAGKVAIITGGASGMGHAQCKLFAAEGAAVCVADIDQEAGPQVAAEIIAAGGRARYTPLDVTSADQWAATVAAAEAEFGKLTTLCNNAGANFRVSFDEQTEAMWHKIIEISLTGAFLGIKAAVPAMRRAGNGAIINIGSIATSRSGNNPGYATSKVGILGFTTRRGQRLRRGQHPLQHGITGPRGHALYPPQHSLQPQRLVHQPRKPRESGAARQGDAHGPHGPAGRDRLCLSLSRLRRSRHGHRHKYQSGWWGEPVSPHTALT